MFDVFWRVNGPETAEDQLLEDYIRPDDLFGRRTFARQTVQLLLRSIDEWLSGGVPKRRLGGLNTFGACDERVVATWVEMKRKRVTMDVVVTERIGDRTCLDTYGEVGSLIEWRARESVGGVRRQKYSYSMVPTR